MSLFIDSRAGLVLSIWLVIAVVLNSDNNFLIAKLTVWVWCGIAIMNGQIVCVYRRFLTNHLHVKAAELCLANS